MSGKSGGGQEKTYAIGFGVFLCQKNGHNLENTVSIGYCTYLRTLAHNPFSFLYTNPHNHLFPYYRPSPPPLPPPIHSRTHPKFSSFYQFSLPSCFLPPPTTSKSKYTLKYRSHHISFLSRSEPFQLNNPQMYDLFLHLSQPTFH